MNAVAEIKQAGALAAMTEDELVTVLQSSLYPGASLPSIKLVLGYCKAAGLDPMQKPVHIVPMWDGKAKQMRDVVMPGVGLYRTQAARTGAFAGQTEPEFGPMITTKLGGQEITYPEWARVTVKKSMSNGQTAEFTALEYWIENYAVKGGQEKSIAPNAMWLKRPRGQIAKCAAAQALRLAFPEAGAQPTAEEMEGKSLDDSGDQGTVFDAGTGEIVQKPAAEKVLPGYSDADFEKNMVIWRKVIASGKKDVDGVLATVATIAKLTEDQAMAIRTIPAELLKAAGQKQPDERTGPVTDVEPRTAQPKSGLDADEKPF
jgi:phage recombination protein Bet